MHNPLEHRERCGIRGVSSLTYVFGAVLLLNGVMTLGLTYAPVPSYLTSVISEGADGDVLIFSTTIGRAFAVICFFLGITDGAFMTLLGPMLEYYLDDTNFPAGLGISLCIIGAFNLAGTLIGGRVASQFLFLLLDLFVLPYYIGILSLQQLHLPFWLVTANAAFYSKISAMWIFL